MEGGGEEVSRSAKCSVNCTDQGFVYARTHLNIPRGGGEGCARDPPGRTCGTLLPAGAKCVRVWRAEPIKICLSAQKFKKNPEKRRANEERRARKDSILPMEGGFIPREEECAGRLLSKRRVVVYRDSSRFSWTRNRARDLKALIKCTRLRSRSTSWHLTSVTTRFRAQVSSLILRARSVDNSHIEPQLLHFFAITRATYCGSLTLTRFPVTPVKRSSTAGEFTR